MSTLLALPSPSSAQSPSGLAKLRQMLASDAPAVQPIRRVPGEDERKRSSSDQPLEATDEALRRSGQAGADQSRAATKTVGGASGGFAIGGASAASGPVSPGPTPQTALPNAGFITQSLHQEVVGSGLHIEPWTDAIDAYRRADAGVNTPLVTQIAV